ncbi:MAG: aldehyde:ferredoxin oxidoreductase, partial [Firmicutes bacterium]|nr:aldehyde:ferredoxin oxidoreductase [Bacillota bacterium]
MAGQKSVRVLEIDLTGQKVQVHNREDLAPFLGGIGLAAKLFTETVDYGKEPLDPAQPVVIAIGPLSTIFPMVTKAVAVFRSPLTGEWGESYAGMRIALAMRLSGYQAVVIRGRAGRPTYLTIGPNGIHFKNASALWGLPTDETGRILRRLAPGAGFRSCLRIGPAGEKQVAFANVNVDTYRHFGRLGLGAVFGSKMLKAAVIYGDRGEPVPDTRRYREVYDRIYQAAVNTDVMEKYHGLGTSGNVSVLNGLGALPTRNLSESAFDHAEEIAGEAFARDSLVRKVACSGCPVGCIHIGVRRRLFGPGHDYESAYLGYDHELIFALGSFLGMTARERIYDLIEAVELSGLDAISAGVLLGWLTEAQQKGVVSVEEVGVELAYDHAEGYLRVLENLVLQPNGLYRTLARGTYAAAETLGGRE